MPDNDRTQIRRRLALAAGLVVLIVVAAIVVFGRPEPPPPQAPAKTGPAPLVVNAPPLPLPPPPLNRAELIAAAGRAASAAAMGKPPPAQDAALGGRVFRIAIPFGCAGPAEPMGPGPSWSADKARGTIKLTAQPQIWTEEAWVHDLAGVAEAEAVEGFWLPRPWLLSGDCPAPATAPSTTPPAQELGLAMFFDADSSRVLRRGERPYEHVMNAPAGTAAAPAGYRLILAGRLVGFAAKDVVRCHVADRNRRPVCLFAVAFDRVAFEDPAGGVLAEWRLN